jgi:hypothetical protein
MGSKRVRPAGSRWPEHEPRLCSTSTRLPDGRGVTCELRDHPETPTHLGWVQGLWVYWGGPLPVGVEATVDLVPPDSDAPPPDDEAPPPPEREYQPAVRSAPAQAPERSTPIIY